MFSWLKNLKYDGIKLMYMLVYVLLISYVISTVEMLFIGLFFQMGINVSELQWSFFAFVSSFSTPLIVVVIFYILKKVLSKKLKDDIDNNLLNFFVGIYILLMTVPGVLRILENTGLMLYSVIFTSRLTLDNPSVALYALYPTNIMIFLSIVALIKIYIGFYFVKKSGYLLSKLSEEV